jgi:hypothetical protein
VIVIDVGLYEYLISAVLRGIKKAFDAPQHMSTLWCALATLKHNDSLTLITQTHHPDSSQTHHVLSHNTCGAQHVHELSKVRQTDALAKVDGGRGTNNKKENQKWHQRQRNHLVGDEVREIGALAIDYPASNARRASFAAVAGNVGDSATRLRTTHHRDAHHRAQNVHGLECILVLHNNCISFIY